MLMYYYDELGSDAGSTIEVQQTTNCRGIVNMRHALFLFLALRHETEVSRSVNQRTWLLSLIIGQ